MQKKISSIIRVVLLLSIGILLLWLTFRNENVFKIFDKIKHANIFYVSISIVCGFTAFEIRAYRWNMLIHPLGYKPKLSNASYALGLGYFANLAIPRIGEISRCGALSKAEKIPFEKLIGTVITERIIDVFMLAFSILLAAALQFNLMKNFLMEKIITPILVKSNPGNSSSLKTIIIVAVIVLVILMGAFIKGKYKEKIKNTLVGMTEGLKSLFNMKETGKFIFHTFLMWFLYFLAAYACFFALEATSHLGMKEGVFILVAGGLGMSAPVQGGIGAYHYIVSQALLLFGVASADGIAYATMVHTYQTLLVILLGCISLIMLFRLKKSERESNHA